MSGSAGLTLALAKGRICDEALPLLASAGIEPSEDPAVSRKLRLPTSHPGVHLLVIRPADVPVFVSHGAADLGIVGLDTLFEYDGGGLYEPLDLDIARCRLMVAAPVGRARPTSNVRVATKYVRSARRHYAQRGQQVEIIKLNGSMELAPLVGLADEIVDLVDSGRTLSANGLEAVEHIADISSRLIVNRASMKMRHDAVVGVIDDLGQAARRSAREVA